MFGRRKARIKKLERELDRFRHLRLQLLGREGTLINCSLSELEKLVRFSGGTSTLDTHFSDGFVLRVKFVEAPNRELVK